MPGHLRDADGTEETGIVPVCIQRRKARLQSAPTGDLRARLQRAPTGDLP